MSDLHRDVSRLAAGLMVYGDAVTSGAIRSAADEFATKVIERVRADERERIDTAISHVDLPTPAYEGDVAAVNYALGFTTMWEVARKIARSGGRDASAT